MPRASFLRGVWILVCGILRPRKRPFRAAALLLGALLVLALTIHACLSVLDHPAEQAALVDEPPLAEVASRAPGRPAPGAAQPWPRDAAEVNKILDRVYTGVQGISLSKEDVAKASAKGTFQKTYGEFEPSGVDALLQELNVSHTDVFCDLGSGTGKVVMQAFLQARPAEAMGLELSEQRHLAAVEARERLLREVPSVAEAGVSSSLRYVNADIMEAEEELSRCNKIFFCSTVWPKDLLARMEQKFLSLQFQKRPVLIASSRELKAFGTLLEPKKTAGVRFLRHRKVDTSWGASFITLYALQEP